ncbi:hypothetical protein [Rhodospirillum rubrum]|nr:hypothetical protein [Rhodospirillum rubrum]AEO48033.1 hypothetical protein F11_07815 [Rhodospirillum rubrum F11]QXG81956.1 hypothetical protein KUL73_07840 [Rhodospirillum rubrum]
MLNTAKAIERYTDGVSREAFLQDTEKQIEILGDAADRLMKSDAAYAVNFLGIPLRDIKVRWCLFCWSIRRMRAQPAYVESFAIADHDGESAALSATVAEIRSQAKDLERWSRAFQR